MVLFSREPWSYRRKPTIFQLQSEKNVSAPQNVIAVIFDFDDTLTDDSTTQLLQAYGIDPVHFWQNQMKKRVEEGWDPALAYLDFIAANTGKGKAFEGLSNKKLSEFGGTLKFYKGLKTLFSDLKKSTQEHPLSNPVVEFYIISGGIEEIIRGSKIAKHITEIWGCRFAEGPDGMIRGIKNVVSFTEKTRFLFEINKGCTNSSRNQPYNVNERVSPEDRRIPFENMIYVGDGLTDVPCFSLLERNGGRGFGVFDPKRDGSPKKGWEKLVAPKRVVSLNAPRYGKNDDLGSLLRVAVSSICSDLDLKTRAFRAS